MESKLSLHKFYFDGITRARVTGERYCQAMFNHLHEVRPDLSEQVRGTENDPFYCPSPKDPRWDRFVAFIESNWWSNPSVMSQEEMRDIVAGFSWHGSGFPIEDCFAAIKGLVPDAQHGRLRELIQTRSTAHNASLE